MSRLYPIIAMLTCLCGLMLLKAAWALPPKQVVPPQQVVARSVASLAASMGQQPAGSPKQQQAENEQRKEHLHPIPKPGSPSVAPACPLVYVYNVSMLQSHQERLQRQAFGPVLAGGTPGLFDSHQHSIGAVILWRLLMSNRCRTNDPSRAALFAVPLLMKPIRAATPEENGKQYDFLPPNHIESIQPMCDLVSSMNLTEALPHLTAATASRHLLVPGGTVTEFHYICSRLNPRFEQRMRDDMRLARIPRLISGVVDPANPEMARASMPLVSSVHLTGAQVSAGRVPWALREPHERPWLLSYGGSVLGSGEAQAIRKTLVAKCAQYGNTTCWLLNCNGDQTSSRCAMAAAGSLRRAFEAKQRSVFCLEPPGYGYERKSMADALTLGCIPVTFTTRIDSHIWPSHWGAWRHKSRVLLDGLKVISGEVDVLAALRNVSQTQVREMQRTIADNAHRIHYALDDSPADAFEVLLDTLSRA